jgi:hypothetical protein
MAALDFVGWLSRAKYSRGNPRSSDQSMVALLASYPPWRHRLGASLLRSILSPSLGSFRGNPRSGSPRSDDGNMCHRSTPWGHRFWSWCWLEGLCSGATCIYLVDDGETRPRGAAGSRRWPWLDGLAQDGGAVRRHGGVDSKSCKINTLVLSEDGFAKDGDGDFESVCVGTR